MKTFEDIIDEMGGMGRFQVLMTFCVLSCQFTAGWSMLQMAFAGMVPDFWCITDHNRDSPETSNNSLNVCKLNGTTCKSFRFESGPLTAIEEWNLVCDQKWVKATITSIQMGGVMCGAFLAGQLSDVFGRKKTLYSFVTLHAILNIVTAFSTTWVMFAALRFFIGLVIGAILVIVFPYPVEFLPLKVRPILSIIPSWSLGVALFSIAALTLKNWSYLHIACGVLTIPPLFGALFVPETVRWLAVKSKMKEAEAVFDKISRLNRKPVPPELPEVLRKIMNHERQVRADAKKYTYLDLFKGWHMTKVSLFFFFLWFSLSVVFYGIAFGVSSLSGNIYLNLFLLAVMELPVQTTTYYLNNKIGRKKTTLLFYILTAISTLGCIIAHFCAPSHIRGPAISGLSLTAKMMVGAAWSAVCTWGTELYPTVTRNLGYGFSNMGARVGGMVAPFMIDLDYHVLVSYSIMTALCVLSCIICLFLRETNGACLVDSLDQKIGEDEVMVESKEEALPESHSRKDFQLKEGQILL